jgi:type IV fimbrial biogenesis protein FimT
MKRTHAGFTLIELMVVVAILAILLAAGMPLARGWAQNNEQIQTRNVVQGALSEARAVALRNPLGATSGTPAVVLRLASNGTAPVFSVIPTNGVNAPDPLATVWTATLPADASVRLSAGGAMSQLGCVAFDNRGQRVPAAANCITSALPTQIAIGWPGTGAANDKGAASNFTTRDMPNVDLL